MRLIKFRFELCLLLLIILWTLAIIVWFNQFYKQQDSQPVDQQVPMTVGKYATELSSYTNFTRAATKPSAYVTLRREPDGKPSWKRILEKPQLTLGFSYSNGRKNVQYVLGVPTVHRKHKTYLEQTLEQLIDYQTEFQRSHCLIVVYIGETDASLVQSIWQEINGKFGRYLDDGLIDVISPPVNYYPDFTSIYITLHDDPERVRWRTKQNLDYMYLMTYAASRGSYYLQLEDDLTPAVGYLDYIIKLSTMQNNFRLAETRHRQWIVMSFCDLGFIGKMFRSTEIKPFLSHVQNFYNDQPIDWLLESYVKLKCCRWDSFHSKECINDYQRYAIRASQSQFQHIGIESSLRDKEQKLMDQHFRVDSGRLRMSHLRQPFNLINAHKSTLLQDRQYLKHGETFFWIYMPHVTSLMRYLIQHQYDPGQIRIRSGPNNAHKFTDLTVDFMNTEPKFAVNGSEKQRCGFIISYTHQMSLMPPYFLFFFMRENEENSNETFWFRRFSWSKAATARPGHWGINILVLLMILI
ncbi:PREDICTED: alpha-1,3-mannosyl-glycoprotein 4-beta-N-acetylglucosaminyltransferase A [Drosophila arizonae]|uniref:Alpha-1,3-mannosyl-glycoprotein 4-beta-N-acetylglucosaminyltransferase A n=1 Tax=Drosophila arizonae TaxID=7263 RepID=A0ABM1P1T2_DROAR|nr:PREDICTED: alpha-1,3-mannosyl-glycoprotein 4-beta-N-acetylglucosaminyltransferase A [Drosophila arizonae]